MHSCWGQKRTLPLMMALQPAARQALGRSGLWFCEYAVWDIARKGLRLTVPAEVFEPSARGDGPALLAAVRHAEPVLLAPVAAVDDGGAVGVGAAVAGAVEAVIGARRVAAGDEAERRVGGAHLGGGGAFLAAAVGGAGV